MDNFGRGMWRRVGDYERGKNSTLRSYLDALAEQERQSIQRKAVINAYRQQILRRVKLESSNPLKMGSNEEESKVPES